MDPQALQWLKDWPGLLPYIFMFGLLAEKLWGMVAANRKLGQDDTRLVIENLQSQIIDLRQQLAAERAACDKKQQDLEQHNRVMEYRLKQLEDSAPEELPLPYWRQDLAGRYVYVNTSFVEDILRPSDKIEGDVLGKTIAEVFGSDLCGVFARAELAAVKSGAVTLGDVAFWPGGPTYVIRKFKELRGLRHVGWVFLAVPVPA